MLHKCAPWCCLIAAIGLMANVHFSTADDPPAKKKTKADAPKAGTVKVEKGPLTAATTVKAMVQAENATEFAVHHKAWAGMLMVVKAVEHGAAVKEGDVLIEFETDKLDQAIRDAKKEREHAEHAIHLAEVELPILDKQAPIDLAIAERDFQKATEDMKRFLEIDRAEEVKSTEFTLKSGRYRVDTARDELKQLQKMYRDKDLTEETEQMILKRYKFTLEMAEFYAEQTKVKADETLKIKIPRQEELLRDTLAKSTLALAKAREVAPLALRQKHLALDKMRFEDVKAKEKLAELEKDRAALAIKAPSDGIAYHGRYADGQWTIPHGAQGSALLPGSQLPPGNVFCTLISPTKFTLRADVDEKDLAGLKAGLSGNLKPTASPDKRIGVRIDSIAAAPRNGKFEVRMELDKPGMNGLMPGMTGNVRFVTSHKENALTVPSSAVFEDAADDGYYVYLPKDSGTPTKKTVKIGMVSGDRTEIRDGLAEGDEILSAKP